MIKDRITILTLFAGRWHTLEPFIHSLKSLDWPRKNIHLIWYTNASPGFVDVLRMNAQILENDGFSVEIVHDKTVHAVYRVFHDGDQRSEGHLNIIAALYNAAWQYVKTSDVLLIEDDVIAPSHSIRRLIRAMDENKNACLISSCVFDRHRSDGSVFTWDIVQAPVHLNGKMSMGYQLVPVGQPWGVRKVSATGFACTLIRRSRLPIQLKQKYPFRVFSGIRGMKHISGTDITFCVLAQKYGKEVYADFDVRPLHIDAQARLH